MRKPLILLVIISLIHSTIISQSTKDRAFILKQTKVEKLQKLSEICNNHFKTCLGKGLHKELIFRIVNNNKKVGHLSGFDINENPIYDYDDNKKTAISGRVSNIWIGGSSGLNLDENYR